LDVNGELKIVVVPVVVAVSSYPLSWPSINNTIIFTFCVSKQNMLVEKKKSTAENGLAVVHIELNL
jgi:hypothetical protein